MSKARTSENSKFVQVILRLLRPARRGGPSVSIFKIFNFKQKQKPERVKTICFSAHSAFSSASRARRAFFFSCFLKNGIKIVKSQNVWKLYVFSIHSEFSPAGRARRALFCFFLFLMVKNQNEWKLIVFCSLSVFSGRPGAAGPMCFPLRINYNK